MKKLFYICLILGITSCVSKSEYEKLEFEVKRLQEDKHLLETELADLRNDYYKIMADYDGIVEAKRREEIERNKIKYVSETEAVGYVKDYYNFYKTERSHRNIKLRRTGENSFIVSIDEAFTFTNIWSNNFYTLVVNNDDTYSYTRTSY